MGSLQSQLHPFLNKTPKFQSRAGFRNLNKLPQYAARKYQRNDECQQTCIDGRLDLQSEKVPEVYY